MQVRPDCVIINISPSQKKLLRDSACSPYLQGALTRHEGTGRGKVAIEDVGGLCDRLREFQNTFPDVGKRKSVRNQNRVIGQIILKLENAEAAQQRAYGKAGLKP